MAANGNGKDVRGRLAHDASADYELILAALKSAMEATKTVRFTCKNPKCGLKQDHEVSDNRTALEAAKTYIDQGYGKAPTQRDDSPPVNTDVDITKVEPNEREELLRALGKMGAAAGLAPLNRAQVRASQEAD